MSKQEKEQNNGAKGGNKKVFVVTVIAVVIIAVLIGVIVFLLNSQEEEENEKRNVVVTPENVEEVLEELEEEEIVEPGYYTVTMDTTWHFANGNEPSYDAVVLNVETNTNDVYFDIVLESDESVVLYESPVIPIGSRLENIALDTVLDAGTYDCVVIYHLVDEEQQTISTLRVTLKIVIEG